jgi:hypothetical protein
MKKAHWTSDPAGLFLLSGSAGQAPAAASSVRRRFGAGMAVRNGAERLARTAGN